MGKMKKRHNKAWSMEQELQQAMLQQAISMPTAMLVEALDAVGETYDTIEEGEKRNDLELATLVRLKEGEFTTVRFHPEQVLKFLKEVAVIETTEDTLLTIAGLFLKEFFEPTTGNKYGLAYKNRTYAQLSDGK